MISESSANFIEGLVKDAEEKGAKLQQKYKREQNLIWPVLIDHVTAVSPLLLLHRAPGRDILVCLLAVEYVTASPLLLPFAGH